jgi:hypothetical protein
MHRYSLDCTWDCDESGIQVGKNGGGVVIAKTRVHLVHSIVPNRCEWLFVLICINAAVPFFYIFRKKQFG